MLRNAVVLDEELLEFVYDQERAGKRFGASGPFVARKVLNAEPAEKITAPPQFFIHSFQDTQPEFPIAFDRDDPRMRQPATGVALEFDTLLEVHKVELDLVRAAPEREVGDEDVKQRGFARARFAGDEGMLASALTQREVLKLGRARASDGDANFGRGLQRPKRGILRGNFGKRHFHPVGVRTAAADLREERRGEIGIRWRVQKQSCSLQWFAGQKETATVGADANAGLSKIVRGRFHRFSLVPVNQGVHAAPGSA